MQSPTLPRPPARPAAAAAPPPWTPAPAPAALHRRGTSAVRPTSPHNHNRTKVCECPRHMLMHSCAVRTGRIYVYKACTLPHDPFATLRGMRLQQYCQGGIGARYNRHRYGRARARQALAALVTRVSQGQSMLQGGRCNPLYRLWTTGSWRPNDHCSTPAGYEAAGRQYRSHHTFCNGPKPGIQSQCFTPTQQAACLQPPAVWSHPSAVPKTPPPMLLPQAERKPLLTSLSHPHAPRPPLAAS
jgi:hypothetical protein